MLAQAFIISLLLSGVLGSSEVLKRQSDHCTDDCARIIQSCSGGPQSCPCTSAIQQAAQSCLNCLATTDAAAAAGAGLEFNPATLASQFNSNCATSSVSVTIPQGVATGSVGEPSVSASVASTSVSETSHTLISTLPGKPLDSRNNEKFRSGSYSLHRRSYRYSLAFLYKKDWMPLAHNDDSYTFYNITSGGGKDTLALSIQI